MAFEFVGVKIFSALNLFENGLISFTFQMILWLILIYSICRPLYEKPFDKSLEIILPPILVSFILIFFNFGAVLTGIGTFIALVISLKYYNKIKWHPFLTISIQLASLLWFFVNFSEFGLLLFFIYISYNLIDGQRIINKNKKK